MLVGQHGRYGRLHRVLALTRSVAFDPGSGPADGLGITNVTLDRLDICRDVA